MCVPKSSAMKCMGLHVTDDDDDDSILMATTQMFLSPHFHPSMPCCHSYKHNGHQQDVDNNKMPYPRGRGGSACWSHHQAADGEMCFTVQWLT